MTHVHLDARTQARRAIREALPEGTWLENEAFTRTLADVVQTHRFCRHPLIDAMNTWEIDLTWLKSFYLDTVHAISGRFTDYLVQAMLNCSALQPRLGARAASAARFLLQINTLDELGFVPGDQDGHFCGDPDNGHLNQLLKVIADIGISEGEQASYVASKASDDVARVIDQHRHDHLYLATVLAVLESSLNPWTECWARGTAIATGMDISQGYHAIHTADHDGHLIDDDHSEDSWYIVRQALTAPDHEPIRQLTVEVLDKLERYADYQLGLLEARRSKTSAGNE
ncbi:hypothetical protein [Pseudomonas sp. zfem002]|uniref:hypothetical protein n=1 Tax=Pseudomonas sp. zfem002 TaxID=3078197 RepID=UPI0029293C44|nr:hypothetical protein [Pseudomonas sp. zfem002]MDU9391291.1 hypothetical protein [Pseudomonas sp. zfem002]